MSAGNHDLELKELEALRFSARASRAITTLEVQRKALSREYGERIKKIRAVILLIQQHEQMGQLSIDGIGSIDISPELKSLIYNPTGGVS